MGRIYKRENVWYLDIRYSGRRLRKRLGKSKRIAELALKDAEVKIAKEEFGFTKKDIPITELINLFLQYSHTNHRLNTTKRYQAAINHFSRFLKREYPEVKLASQISPNLVESYKSFRRNTLVNPNGMPVRSEKDIKEYTRKGARARTVNLEVESIKTMLNMAVQWEHVENNPLKVVKALKDDDKKPLRCLDVEECKLFLDKCSAELFPVYFTFLSTGMRKAELENLQWADVDFARRKLLIRAKVDWNPKTANREIPISDELYNVIRDLKAKSRKVRNSDLVFTVKNSGHSHNRLRRELIKIATDAGIEDLTKLHTLRHTFASHLIMSGVDLPTVQKLMGHSNIQTTMIYAHLTPDHLAEAVNKLKF